MQTISKTLASSSLHRSKKRILPKKTYLRCCFLFIKTLQFLLWELVKKLKGYSACSFCDKALQLTFFWCRNGFIKNCVYDSNVGDRFSPSTKIPTGLTMLPLGAVYMRAKKAAAWYICHYVYRKLSDFLINTSSRNEKRPTLILLHI